jgi:hypothetical protein
MTQFRFIISGDAKLLTESQKKTVHHKSVLMSPFILEETHKFFAEVKISKEEIESTHRTCNGIPGYLASVRRLIASGTPASQILDEAPEKLPNLFQLEWRKVNRENEIQLTILSILAHDKKRHTISEFANLLSKDRSVVEQAISTFHSSQYRKAKNWTTSPKHFAASRQRG